MKNGTNTNKNKNLKKSLLISLGVVVFVSVAVLASLVGVLASSTQEIDSSVVISYTAKEVTARIKIREIQANGSSRNLTSSTDVMYNDYYCITPTGTTGTLGQSNVQLNGSNYYVVYEYEFVNTGTRMVKASMGLSNDTVGDNISLKYYFSNTQITDPSGYSLIDNTTMAPQAISGRGANDESVFFYVKAYATEPQFNGSLSAKFQWTFDGSDAGAHANNVTLNDNGGSNGATSIKAIMGAKLPVLSTIPTGPSVTGGNAVFLGYFDQASGGTQYIDARGLPIYNQVWGNEATVNPQQEATQGPSTLFAHYSTDLVVDANGLRAVAANKANIVTLVIPTTITKIATEGFKGCTNLVSVIIPSSVTTIGARAFQNCTSLLSVVWEGHDYVTEVGPITNSSVLDPLNRENSVVRLSTTENSESVGLLDYAFEGCTSLRTVVIRKDVEAINSGVFYGCNNLQSLTIPWLFANNCPTAGNTSGGIANEKYYSSFQALFLPQSELSYNNQCRKMSSAYEDGRVIRPWSDFIPTTLANITINYVAEDNSGNVIGDNAFMGMSYLKRLVFTDDCGVESLGDNVAYGCSNLILVALPNSLDSIGDGAFKSCIKLASIELPNSLTEIGSSAFQKCQELVDINLPTGLDTLGSYAFENTKISLYTVPAGIDTLEEGVFKGCTRISSFIIPNSVDTIGNGAFDGCTNLTTLNFTAGGSGLTIEENAFQGCPKLKFVTLPARLTSISTQSFNPANIEEIYSLSSTYVVANNCLLKNGADLVMAVKGNATHPTVLPDGMTGIEIGAIPASFGMNIWDNGRYIPYDFNNDGVISSDERYTILVAPADINASSIEIHPDTKIVYSLQNMSNLKELRIPEGVTSITEGFIKGCTSLEYLEFPELSSIVPTATRSYLDIFTDDDLGEVGHQDKYSSLKFIKVVAGSNNLALKDYAFKDCESVEFVDVDFDYTSIGKQAFYNSGIRTIILPSVKHIGVEAFANCSNLDTYYFGTDGEIYLDRASGDIGTFGGTTPTAKYVSTHETTIYFLFDSSDLNGTYITKLNGANNSDTRIVDSYYGIGVLDNLIIDWTVEDSEEYVIMAITNSGSYVDELVLFNCTISPNALANRSIGTLNANGVDWLVGVGYAPDHVDTLITYSYVENAYATLTGYWTTTSGKVDKFVVVNNAGNIDLSFVALDAEVIYLFDYMGDTTTELNDLTDVTEVALTVDQLSISYPYLTNVQKLYIIPTASQLNYTYTDFVNSVDAQVQAYLSANGRQVYTYSALPTDGNGYFFLDADGNYTNLLSLACNLREW